MIREGNAKENRRKIKRSEMWRENEIKDGGEGGEWGEAGWGVEGVKHRYN